jgi:pimeloyl-ACP methyl ester carboxylesterase
MSVLFEHRLHLAGYRTRALELDGEGPPMLLLHGYSDSADTWRPLLDRLRPLRRRAIALDLPGFGTASRLRPEEPVLAQHDAFVRAALVRFAQDEPAIVSGNSLGGCLAIRAAEDEKLPIAGIVPIAPAGLDMARWITIIEGERLLRALLSSPVPIPGAIVRQVVGQAYRQLAFARPRRADPRVVAAFTSHFAGRRDVARRLAIGRALKGELTDPFRLERIRCPVLIVWGDRDRMVFSSGAERVISAVPGARLELIGGCGHCPQVEVPERLAELLEEFAAAPLAATA